MVRRAKVPQNAGCVSGCAVGESPRGGVGPGWYRWATRGCCLLLLLGPLHAHDTLGEYVHHRVQVAAGTGHLDLTLQLTFFEEGSYEERRRMDADEDGRISRAELEAYSKALAGRIGGQVRLWADEAALALVPLYAPEVDLLGDTRVNRAHHRLTLYYFARVPKTLSPGTVLVVEEGLWPAWPSVVVPQAVNRQDASEVWLRPEAQTDSLLPRLREGMSRRFTVAVEARSSGTISGEATRPESPSPRGQEPDAPVGEGDPPPGSPHRDREDGVDRADSEGSGCGPIVSAHHARPVPGHRAFRCYLKEATHESTL